MLICEFNLPQGPFFVPFSAPITVFYKLCSRPEHGRLLGEVTSKQQDIYEALLVKPPSL